MTPKTELAYVPLVTWACSRCEVSGRVEEAEKDWLTRDRAIAAHAEKSPLCAEVFGSERLSLGPGK